MRGDARRQVGGGPGTRLTRWRVARRCSTAGCGQGVQDVLPDQLSHLSADGGQHTGNLSVRKREVLPLRSRPLVAAASIPAISP